MTTTATKKTSRQVQPKQRRTQSSTPWSTTRSTTAKKRETKSKTDELRLAMELALSAKGVVKDRALRLNKATSEARGLAKWKRDGSTGTAPATPNVAAIDAIKAFEKAGGRVTSRSAASGRAAVQYTKDGSPISASQNKLSSMAYWYTGGIDGDAPRVSTARFLELLQELGVEDPRQPGWEVTLPNGKKLGAKKAA
jgi:hypothetical protein